MLDQIDLSRHLSKPDYKRVFPPLQERLRALQRACKEAGIPTVIVMEGWDAAGKGSMVSLLLERLDPRGFKVHSIGPPSSEEIHRPFLWRFWLALPAYGEMAVFDRSWYGRVLVERIDKLTAGAAWKRAYQEINEFERTLATDGQVIVKFFLHISKDEQRKRFQRCQKDPVLAWKVTDEDWKHHRQYAKYLEAVEEMLQHTSTEEAPWQLVEATDRRWAEVKVFDALIEQMEARISALEADKVVPAAEATKTAPATGASRETTEALAMPALATEAEAKPAPAARRRSKKEIARA